MIDMKHEQSLQRPQINELGFYTLPGAPKSPRDLIHEVESAEELGIGACFISERFNIKEAVTVSGRRSLEVSRNCYCRNQSQHSTPPCHRFLRHHHAPPH